MMGWLRNLMGYRAAQSTPPEGAVTHTATPPVVREVPVWFDLMNGVDDPPGSIPPDYDGTRTLADKGWAGLTTAAQGAFTKLQNEAYRLGISIVMTEGFRPRRRQAYLYSLGRRMGPPPFRKWGPDPTSAQKIVTRALPGKSSHNGGQAFDIVIKGTDPYNEALLARVGAKGPLCGLRWGGTYIVFKDGTTDMPHFEIVGAA